MSWISIDQDEVHGTFNLPEASIFEVDVVLADKSPSPSTGWDGETVTKRGDGTWILSGANTDSGATNIEAGTLVAGAVDTLASTEGSMSIPGPNCT